MAKGGFRALMDEADINCAQLARRLNVSRAIVYAWRHDKSKPNSERWRDIAKHLGVTLDEVVRCFV